MNEFIKAEFLRRKRENAQYSLRAFAGFLQIPPGRLSEIISGKRAVSKKVGEKISHRLGLRAVNEFISPRTASDYALLPDDVFSVLADWYHFAILSLMETSDFRYDAKWISKRLGISALESREALRKMERLGIVTVKNGRARKTNKNVKTTTDIENMALRMVHKQKLEHALRCLLEVPIEARDITSMTMAIDIKKLPLAKKVIQDFRVRMAEFLESGNQTEVYNLNIQLIPVTRGKVR